MEPDAQVSHAPHGGLKLYSMVLGGLICLTILTVAAAGVNFGSPGTNTVIALVIASAKASLVALFFMHLRWDKPMNAIIFVSTLAFLGLLLIFTLADFSTRTVIIPMNAKETPAIVQPAAGAEGAHQAAEPPAH